MANNFEIQLNGDDQNLVIAQFESASGALDPTKGSFTLDLHDIWAASAGASAMPALKARLMGMCDLTTGEPVNVIVVASEPFPLA